jgi:hypothetical protein
MTGKRVRIGGQYWRVVLGTHPGSCCGQCDYQTRTITVRQSLPPLERKATAIHEALHAAYPDLDEDAVMRGEYAVMSVLRACGLAIVEDD